jgi:aspartate carbamoyltransferase catalytic subunit
MDVIAVESAVAPVPQSLVKLGGSRLQRTTDLDGAMRAADVLSIGRNPDEYTGDDPAEQERSLALKAAYAGWVVDDERLQQMNQRAIVLHPRPRRDELHPSVDGDPRMKDVWQMQVMTPMRMAIIARHAGVPLVAATA